MAETALDVISRCRVTSVSSSVTGFGGAWSVAAGAQLLQEHELEKARATHGRPRPVGSLRPQGEARLHSLSILWQAAASGGRAPTPTAQGVQHSGG